MRVHSAENRVRSQWTAEEAGVEPTEDAGRPPTGLKPARVTGPDALPKRFCGFYGLDQGPKTTACATQANTSALRSTMRTSPVRRVAPILSRYSSTSIVKFRPTPERSLKLAAVNVPSGELSASSRAIPARR